MIEYSDIVEDLKRGGLEKGDTVFVQSALSPIGFVEGGAQTVVKAFLDVLGAEGTLCAPTFCFKHEAEENPIIDPVNDKSEMGAISEAIRLWPGAKRSIAYRHSVSSIGKYADFVTDTDMYLSVFDVRSSFGRMLALDAKVVLLGVTYLNSTTHHFAEYILKVPDRHTVEKHVMLRRENGALVNAIMTDYQPKPTEGGEYYSFPHDFNRAGRMLEEKGLVTITNVGNAVTRIHRMRDLVHLFLDHYAGTYNLFAVDGKETVLPDGEMVSMDYLDGAGRVDTALWCCVDASKRVPSSKGRKS